MGEQNQKADMAGKVEEQTQTVPADPGVPVAGPVPGPEEAQGPSGAGQVQEDQAAPDPLASLRQELEQARAKEAEYLDGWQRARAELANARKRFQREQEQVYSNAKADVMVQLLPIVDDLERAFETLPDNLSRLTWIEGLMLIQRKLSLLLERSGAVVIGAIGQEFNPMVHEAISHEPSETVPAGQIIAEFQKGYQMGDRVLRPSLVRVSAGPPPQPEPEFAPLASEPGAGRETPNDDEKE